VKTPLYTVTLNEKGAVLDRFYTQALPRNR
jgi:hypothetical protein